MLKSRIAPTPNGYLHIGNAVNFVLAWLHVRKAGGKLLLRIDDLDQERTRPEYVEDIFRTLDWLGLDYDEGPEGPNELSKIWSQVHRLPLYRAGLDRLATLPDVFACTCSRRDIRALSSKDGQYPGTCRFRGLSLNSPEVNWRILTPESEQIAIADEWMGELEIRPYDLIRDCVVRKKDGFPAYQLSSLIDDLHFGVNSVVRGEDLLPSTAIQLYLAQRLGYKSFLQVKWVHHPLIADKSGNKLSKSFGSEAIWMLRESGARPHMVYQKVKELLGLDSGVKADLGELLEEFPSFRRKNH